MREADRDVFHGLLAMLFGAFPAVPMTDARRDAYWRGLAEMTIEVFDRCVTRAIGERGEERIPTVTRLWAISRELRAVAPASTAKPPPELDAFARFGNRCLYAYLRIKGPASDASLHELLAVKNKLVDAVRSSCHGDEKYCDDSGDTIEFREMLLAAFANAFEARTWGEMEADREAFCVAHGMHFVPVAQPPPHASPSPFTHVPDPEQPLTTEDSP